MAETGAVTLEDRELGTKPITKLFLKYSMITLLGMLAQAIMVVFEGIIIGTGLGANGFAIVALLMPLETLNLALGGLFGLGIATMVGIKLGNNDTEGARRVFAQGVWFTLITIVTLAVLIIIFAHPVAKFLGAPADLENGLVLMMRIFMIFYPLCILGQMLSCVARVDEKPGLVTWVWTGAAAVALLELYLSVIVFKVGLAGAAVYYGMSIGLFSVLIFYFLFSKKTVLKIHLSDIKLDFKEIGQTMKIGLPTFLISASLFVYSVVINNMLSSTGTEMDIASYGLINGYVLYFVNMFCQAFQGGLAPIVSYNFGAKNFMRLRQALTVSNIVNVIVMAVLCFLTYLAATPIIAMFAAGDAQLTSVASAATRIVIILGALGSASGMLSVFYQSVEKVGMAILFGICRYALFALPLVVLLPKLGYGVQGIWYAHPAADAITGVFCLIFIFVERKRLLKCGLETPEEV